jgi:hypothetical protein
MREVINFSIANNTNATVPVSLFGNTADQMDTANATTQYSWNLTSLTITNETQYIIEYRWVNESTFTLFTGTFSGTNLQSIVDSLNTLNLGYFFITTSGGNSFLNNYNQNIVFRNLNIYSSQDLITLFDFYEGTPNYNNTDASVLDTSSYGNNGTPVIGNGNGTPTLLTYMQYSPFPYLQVPSDAGGLQFAVRLNDACKFAGLLPYTLITWFSSSDLAWGGNAFQGLISSEGRNPAAIGYQFYIGYNGVDYFLTHGRFNLSTAILAVTTLTFGTTIPTTFTPNAYYMAAAGFDGTNMYLSVFSTDGNRYDTILPNSYSIDTISTYSAFLGIRYNNWLNGTIAYAAIYETWTGYEVIQNIYNQTKSRYGY